MSDTIELPLFDPPALSDNKPLLDTGLHPLHGASSSDPLVTEYLLAARANNAQRAYDADLRHFLAWGGHLPSDPDEVARYLAYHAGVLQPVTLRRRLAALATIHKVAGVADPTKNTIVLCVVQGIERRHGHPPKQVAPLMIGDFARIVSRTLQSIRDWVLRFNSHGPDGLIDIKAPRRTPKLNKKQRRALKEIVEAGPIPAIHGVVRWRLIDLVQWLSDEFGVSLDETTVGRYLKANPGPACLRKRSTVAPA